MLSPEVIPRDEATTELEERIVKIQAWSIYNTLKDVRKHELYLANLMENENGYNDEEYRDRHKAISRLINHLKNDVSRVRMDVYQLVELNELAQV